MTDEERQKFISDLKMADFVAPLVAKKLCRQATEEIERLVAENKKLRSNKSKLGNLGPYR